MLPEEIWYNIFLYFSVKELIKLSKVCSQFRRICLDENIWSQKAEFIKGQSIIGQYVKWKNKLKQYTGSNCAIESLEKIGEKIITRFSKNYTFDTLINYTLIPGIMINKLNHVEKSITNSLKKTYNSFHRTNKFRLDSYSNQTKLTNIKHDLRRFYILVIPPNHSEINMIQYYLNAQYNYHWINIFAIVCSDHQKNILLAHKFNKLDAKIKFFDQNQYTKIFQWIAEMVWIDDFKFNCNFCLKQIPDRKELYDLTTKSILPISNTCYCQ
ncbi:F-box protein [Megavirus baoshan]|uniref:F-box protein n=1 Tax=Megavirus baoshan TaxID=2496520 RepID=A0A3S8UXR7_9VIRU|nr:F-box protein [Megavirus baoshan]AZL89602.1 F-box protein [Megavirus baoshan]